MRKRWINLSWYAGKKLPASIIFLALFFLASAPVFADSKTRNYSIAEQPLSAVLMEFARQSDLQLFAPGLDDA